MIITPPPIASRVAQHHCMPAHVRTALAPEAFTHPSVLHLGMTSLAVHVDAHGHVQKIVVLHRSRSPRLDDAFIYAAKRSTYAPERCGCQTKSSEITLSHDWDKS